MGKVAWAQLSRDRASSLAPVVQARLRAWMGRRRFSIALLVAVTIGVSAAAVSWAHGSRRSSERRQNDQTSFTLVAAADIACMPGEVGVPPNGRPNGPDNCQQAATAALIEGLKPDAVAVPGDIQYERGRLAEFLGSFGSTWGAFKPSIYPAAGNHEWYDSPNGRGYFDYFDGVGRRSGRAGARGHGYYSVDLNRYWHLITLNSNCTTDNALIVTPVSCRYGSAQERWLRSDLAAHRGQCIIAQWHHPLFTSGPNQGGPNDISARAARACLGRG
ncbi:MAG: hypothetical protein E6J20_20495 [Chloroflexi bacterium]|nr:MAG: hypothetical protein E6J20_20495 [Chloroflexota bacterium]